MNNTFQIRCPKCKAKFWDRAPREPLSNACPYRKLDPDVLVVQSAEDRHDLDGLGCLDSPTARRVLGQR